MFTMVVLVLVFVILGFLLFATTRPNTFRIERTAIINAPAEKIFPQINDFHNWAAWSPFEKLDPEMKKSFSGSTPGKGAVYEWEGNSKAGQGRMEILESVSPSRIALRLSFLKPFKAENNTDFLFEKKGSITSVTWAMYGASSFLWKVMTIFVNMDEKVGKDFAEGLANLKKLLE